MVERDDRRVQMICSAQVGLGQCPVCLRKHTVNMEASNYEYLSSEHSEFHNDQEYAIVQDKAEGYSRGSQRPQVLLYTLHMLFPTPRKPAVHS